MSPAQPVTRRALPADPPRMLPAAPTTSPHPDLLGYWHFIAGRRWLLLALALAGLVVSAVITFRQPRLYEAQATVEFKQALPPGQDLDIIKSKAYVPPELAQRLLTTKVLAARVITRQRQRGQDWFSPPPPTPRSVLGSVRRGIRGATTHAARALRFMVQPAAVDGTQAGPPAPPHTWSGVDLATIGRYYAHIAIRPVRGTSLTDIVVTHPDPGVAAQIANDHAQTFMKMDLETKVASLSDAEGLFGQQLGEVKTRLEASRKALTDYQLQQGILNLPKDASTLTRESLQQLNKLLTEAQGERIIAEAAYRNAASQSPEHLAATLPDRALEAVRGEIQAATAHYQANLQDFGPKHPEMIAMRADLESLRGRLRAEAVHTRDRLRAVFDAARVKENELRENLQALSRAAGAEDRELVQLSILERDVDADAGLYAALLEEAKQAQLQTIAFRWTNVNVVDHAVAPSGPSYPNTRRNLALGLLLGLGLGVFGCLLIERLDTTIHTPDELSAALELPVFGVIPDFRTLPATGNAPVQVLEPARRDVPRRDLVTLRHPASLISEAYRAVRTNLLFAAAGGPPRTVLVTSGQSSEGKTVTVVNLAVTLSLCGARVLIIDADLRRPGCHTALQVAREPGLSNLLAGQSGLADVLRRSPLSPTVPHLEHGHGLALIPAGALPPNPGELLGSALMDRLLETVREQFEFVLIDSPPILPVTDSVVLSTKVDAVLLVVKGAEWGRDVVRRALAHLDAVRARTVGAVLNCVDVTRGGSPYYYYRHYRGYRSYYTDGGGAPPDQAAHDRGMAS